MMKVGAVGGWGMWGGCKTPWPNEGSNNQRLFSSKGTIVLSFNNNVVDFVEV